MANDFDDPFAPADGTVMRPRPGGARRPASDGQSQVRPAAPPPRGGQEYGPAPTPGNLAVQDFISGGRNPILQAAGPLIAVASRLQSTVANADINALRTQAMQDVRQFDERLRAAGVAPEDALVARYVICTFFDSAVLNTPWGAQSDWSGQSLLILFHKEKSGGEKFFQILDRLCSQPQRYIDLIELQYVCLALGYEGMYRIDERGATRLADLQHKLAVIVRDARQIKDQELSVHWRGVEDKRNPIFRYIPWWIVACVGLAILVIAFVIYVARLNRAAEPVMAALSQPSVQVEYTAPVSRANRLKQLLAPQEAAGQLTVEDFGDKTVVTLISSNLFRSGSATFNPQYNDMIAAIANGLNQVPGKVVIVGHTDDVPVRSLQFADNFELSRERAVTVANLLKPSINNFGRVEWVGVGSTQPRYEPVNMAENRARNRRVEIVSVDEGAAQ
ncbi:MAG TPA: type IVB secretion system protein IcmH/DotU [Povalibacter sp.]|uniref:type IVB secretion system protein IcmH/DotU n=1 Tax=Povalibacter sp. TaxID=1962978 RepID=UPI002C05141E|nr:type IVB secretion system protein IcmH/DotU [Povalibacter sp.]HMN43935.1 type IVB secretion system protein IcmH/DotU [Povalibacter sp.]